MTTTSSLIEKLKLLYTEYRKFLPPLFFIGGFLWDYFTLTRIDNLTDNLILLGYLITSGILIILINLVVSEKITNQVILKFSPWYPLILQFFFGGLFSSYVVFYFHSASLTKTAIFLTILVSLLIINEFWEKKLHNLYLQLAVFQFLSFSFFIFFIPVILKRMGHSTFISAGLISLSITLLLIYILYKFNILNTKLLLIKTLSIVFSVFLGINILYFTNIIPPVPLSLKFIGIYNNITRTGNVFLLYYETPPWYKFWKKHSDPIHISPGEKVFCFSAIFAPTQLTKRIYHHWHYNSPERGWISAGRIGFEIIGGRERGFRGYTYKTGISPGLWRVDVETEEGHLVGRIQFKVAIRDPKKDMPLRVYQYK